MRVDLTGVSQGRDGQALPATTVSFRSGHATLAVAETEQRPAVLGLIASGRMRPATGRVTIDGIVDARALRRRVALVDAPDVCDPAPNVSVAGVVAEELMFAGLASDPLSARRWLREKDLRSLARVPIGDVSPGERIRMLLELSALRRVDGLVLVAPDRHGGDPEEWWAIAEDFAARGLAMLVISGHAAATALTGTRAASARLRPSRVRPRRRRRPTEGASL